MISVFGDPIDVTTKPQIFVCGADVFLKALRMRLISFGDPVFDSIQAVVYNVRGTTVIDEIARSSNTIVKSDIPAESFSEIYFEFLPTPDLRKDQRIGIGFAVSNYVATTDVHLAIARSFPNPIYPPFNPVTTNIAQAPQYIGMIGELR